MMRGLVSIGLLVAATVIPSAARAQTPTEPSARSAAPRWEVSFHGGFLLASTKPKGDSHTPPAGPTFIMADGTTPSRVVSSWYFGDGTALLNQVLTARGIGTVHALDFPGWPVASPAGAFFGGGFARHLKAGLWFEGSVDVGPALQFDDATRDRIEVVRADFERAFTALAASAPSVITAATVTSSADLVARGQRLLVSAVFQYRGPEQPIRPVLLGGFGWASSIGSPATLEVTGTYRFTTPSQGVIEETDTVHLSYKTSNSLVWVFGGGFMHDLSRSNAYRVEFRVLAGSTKLSADLEASPSRVTGTPGAVAVLNATNPGLQFSSSSAIAPSLSGPRPAFSAFSGEGAAFQLVLTASYVRRF